MLTASLNPPTTLAALSPACCTPVPTAAASFARRHRRSFHLSTAAAAAASEGATVSQENAASVSAAFDEARRAQFAVDWKSARADKDQGKILTLTVLRSNTGGVILKYRSMQGSKRPIQDVTKDLVGLSISVKLKRMKEKKKLVFSEKDASWSTYSSQVKIGDTYDGIVGSVFHYGAFVHLRFPDGNYHLTGLVHVSEVSWDLVQDVQDFLSEGDTVQVIVVNVDAEKSRIALSIRQLEEDPLLETLDKIIPLEPDLSPDAQITSSPAEIELLPGLEGICNELLEEDGITDVKFGRQALEKRVVSQDLELWLSSIPAKDNQYKLLARAGRQVQEVYLTTSLDQEGVKKKRYKEY